MNVTFDQILALFVMKEARIMTLETELAGVRAELAAARVEADNLLAHRRASQMFSENGQRDNEILDRAG